MVPFLKQVAQYYYDSGKVGNRCFIFPNRRSMAFFRKYLAEAVVASGTDVPLKMPQMLTVNDFFYKVSAVAPADKVRLRLYLYKCYRKLNPKAEPLDEFVFWGDILLGDFNDVDKYLANPKQLFANVADLKQIQDDYSYLTDNQREAIESFISHFSNQSGKLTVEIDSDNPDVRGRFLQIWNILYQLYCDFNKVLRESGLAYEGMVYRDVAQRLKENSAQDIFKPVFPGEDIFVFVGLNTLNECEKRLLRKLKDASLAEFCWDYSGDMIQDPQNRSSLFMSENVREFPQVTMWDEGVDPSRVASINVVSVPSAVGQAKRLSDILTTIEDWNDCAVVLPDENLLLPVLNSVPPHVTDINVTMGLPMKGSLIYSMMETVCAIQMHNLYRKGRWHFYHKQVWDLFANPLFRNAADEKTREIMRGVKDTAKFYIPQEDLSGTPLLDVVFRPVITDLKSKERPQMEAFAQYLMSVISAIAPSAAADSRLALELEYAKEYYKAVNMLLESLEDVEILPLTYVRLLTQLLGMTSVPFRGEPLKGLQIMGPLETRVLDFSNVVIMSSNEGVFPRRSVSSSFVPSELRKAFGLPTYELQDAIWAYYFYRLISRAENVWMMVDSRTEGSKSGEESRYIKQLEYHFGISLKRYGVQTDKMKIATLPEVVKTQEDVDAIRNMVMSATSLQNYLTCPAKFYYSVLKKLKPEEDVSENLDASMVGTVFHEVMQSLYTSEKAMSPDFFFGDPESGNAGEPFRYITAAHIKEWLDRESDIRAKVHALIERSLNVMEVTGRDLVVTDVIVRYVIKTLESDLQLLKNAGKDSFEILGRELNVKGTFHGFAFKGFIDRLDAFGPDEVRVVDYKTGVVMNDDIFIDDKHAAAIAAKIFMKDVEDRPKIALQFYIYDMLLKGMEEMKDRNIYNCVYSTVRLFKELPESLPVNALFYDAVTESLESLLDEMCDPEVNFRRTTVEKVCENCQFKSICGK